MRLKMGMVATLCALASPARADFSLALGLKWVPVSYTQPVTATASAMMGPAATPLTGWQTTSLNNNFGAFFLDGRLGFLIGLDLGYSSRHGEMGTAAATDFSFTQFGFSLGGKFYITPPRRERVSPYVLLDFYKYFASLSTSDKGVSNDQAGYIAGLVSPLGVDVALGAEYFFTPGFSIGAEVLGLKYAYTEGDFSLSGVGGDQKVKTQNQYVTFYTGISLNYRFNIAGSVHVKEVGPEPEEEEKPAPRKHKVVVPPPPPPPAEEKPEEPPPANPEEVD
jgi:hypothetical protein